MSLFDDASLRSALRTRLEGLPGIPSVLAYENEEETPPVDALWIEERLNITREGPEASGTNEAFGEWRLVVNGPKGAGNAAVAALAKQVAERFEAPMHLSSGGQDVILELTRRLGGFIDESQRRGTALWYSVPVVIDWRVFTTRQQA